jgi:hypothetical protein
MEPCAGPAAGRGRWGRAADHGRLRQAGYHRWGSAAGCRGVREGVSTRGACARKGAEAAGAEEEIQAVGIGDDYVE